MEVSKHHLKEASLRTVWFALPCRICSTVRFLPLGALELIGSFRKKWITGWLCINVDSCMSMSRATSYLASAKTVRQPSALPLKWVCLRKEIARAIEGAKEGLHHLIAPCHCSDAADLPQSF
jgi:hypothetical protein